MARPSGKPKGKKGSRQKRPTRDYDQKMVSLRRVTRVVAGGRRFGFSVVMIIGDKKGSVGVGIGKAGDTALAIEKAYNNAKKHLVKLDLSDETFTIPHEVFAKYNSARVMMMPNDGRGIVAGSSMRNILELAGLKDVTAKVISRSKNQLNIARAAIQALQPFVADKQEDSSSEKPKETSESSASATEKEQVQ